MLGVRACEEREKPSFLLITGMWAHCGLTSVLVQMLWWVCSLECPFCVLSIPQPFTNDFPRAEVHELLSPDLLHQVIKGVFKDHFVGWVNEYLVESYGETHGQEIIADIDHWYGSQSSSDCFPSIPFYLIVFRLSQHFQDYDVSLMAATSRNGQVTIQRRLWR